MNSLTQFNRRRNSAANNERSLQTLPPERYTNLVRRRGGLISVPGKLKLRAGENAAATANNRDRRLTKLLLNVNIERSLGPVQVVMSPDNTVNDLIKAATEIYVKEKRRPFLKETDDKFHYELHYSQFSLESRFSVRYALFNFIIFSKIILKNKIMNYYNLI